jgi:hypothetical protein
MISILICSAENSYLDQVRKNIKETIGVEHEILFFDNSKKRFGICAVYNQLAKQAKFPYLCFVHEDILLQTMNWGKILIDICSSRSGIGLIGIAGCKYKSNLFSGWYSGFTKLDCENITHRHNNKVEIMNLKPDKENLIEVVCIDGVFMFSRKDIWERVKFNEKQITGFHFYDIDYSLNVSASSTVFVTYDIDIIHINKGGDFGNDWVETAIFFHSFFKSKLPSTKLATLSYKEELMIAKTWLDFLASYKISLKNKWKWITIQHLHHHTYLYYSIAKFLFYEPLQLKYLHKVFTRTK